MTPLKGNNPITEDGTYRFRVNQGGRYRITVGAKFIEVDQTPYPGNVFDGASVTVRQNRIAFTDLEDVASPIHREVVLEEGQLRITLSGAASSTSVGIRIQPIH